MAYNCFGDESEDYENNGCFQDIANIPLDRDIFGQALPSTSSNNFGHIETPHAGFGKQNKEFSNSLTSINFKNIAHGAERYWRRRRGQNCCKCGGTSGDADKAADGADEAVGGADEAMDGDLSGCGARLRTLHAKVS